MGNLDLSDLWLEGVRRAGATLRHGWGTPRPAKGYVIVSLAWLARVRLQVRSADQLLVALVLYRQCVMRRSRTVNSQHRAAGAGDQPSDQVPRLSRVGGSRGAH